MLTKTHNLDIVSGGVPEVIHLSQYDDDFTLVFTLYARTGEFTVPTGTTATIRGTKKDGNGYQASCSVSGTTVTVTGDKQMTAVAGEQPFEITLYSSEGKELNTANFILAVERAAMDENTVPSASSIMEVETAIVAQKASEAASSATAAAASETNAKASETNAADSASSASASATTATEQATAAATSEKNAATSEANAASSADAASVSATNASASADAASTSATNAATSEKNASDSESAAKAWAVGPSSELTEGTDTENAAAYAAAAKVSQNAASTSASGASNSATAAASSASAASASQTAAAASATEAANSATAAAESATTAMSATPDGYETLATTFNGLNLSTDSDGYIDHAPADSKNDLLSAETGEDIATSLAIIAGDRMASFLTSWDSIGRLCAAGNASKVFNIGDTISEPWIDTANNNTSYDNPWRVNHFSDEEDSKGEAIHGMWLQTKYLYPVAVSLSHERAFLACPDGLSAGTYHFTIGASWGSYVVEGKVYQFTITKDVESGGRLAGFYGMPYLNSANWKVYSYGADGITINETVAPSEGSEGTDLGTMAKNTRTGNLNSIEEMAYGHNRWSTSAMRQYLNSDKTKGEWWTPQDEWDIAPDQLATKDGFLCGMNEEMLRNIVPVKTTTYTNTVQDGGEADITYDKVIIPSLEQMYIEPIVSGEGEAQEYWKLLNGTDTKWARDTIYEILKQYSVDSKTTARNIFVRSAQYDVIEYYGINNNGDIRPAASCFDRPFAPLVFISH